jgi:hypothetical protein
VDIRGHHNSKIAQHLIASATLVDFPQFPDVHRLIPRVLGLTPKHTIQRDYHRIEDSGKWEIYVKYRQIVSQFLTDGARAGGLFVDQSSYVELAIYLALFLTEDMK